MSITDELREYALKHTRPHLLTIADRIDAEHEKALVDARADGISDGIDADFEAKEHHGWVRLPVDADGVPICVGDVLSVYGEKRVCCEMRLRSGGWEVWTPISRHLPDVHGELHHYHPPTVEDLLREMLVSMECSGGLCDANALIAEYAAKLQLRGEDA